MNFKIGEVVTLKHYSGNRINKGFIIDIQNQRITIKPQKDFLIYSYFNNDPIVVGFENEDIVSICEGIINSTNYNNNTITVDVTNIESLINRRICQRFPVSIFAYLFHDNVKDYAYIRNLSLEGLSLCSKQEIDKGKVLNIDTYMEDKNIKIEAQILWKKASKYGFEYGLEYAAGDDFIKYVEKYIELFRKEHESAVKMLNYEFESLRMKILKKVSMN